MYSRVFALFILIAAWPLSAETGRSAWLRYAPVEKAVKIPGVVAAFGPEPAVKTAQQELIRGLRSISGLLPRAEFQLPDEPAILLGTLTELRRAAPQLHLQATLPAEGYWLHGESINGISYTVVTANSGPGVLYGAFTLLRKISLGEAVNALDEKQAPYAPIRWVNQWDNLDGSIERGYGGRSLFWEGGHVHEDLGRASEYARLLASTGINACAINNVNANPRILSAEFIPQIKRVADTFRPWGVRVAISVDFGSPKSVGGLDTFDPLDARVAAWWKTTVDALYQQVPDLAGFVMKADSEGRVGPSAYHRTHADAANIVARALQSHGGLLLYRGFVYDHHMDWRNLKNDRARAADDNFRPLDGKFDDNVIVQIKNGPIDFQVREPASPLFGTLEKTNEAIELQITQEYMGQGRHVVYLVPQWKETLDFDMAARGTGTPVKALAAGKTFQRPYGGMVGVANVGLDDNWFGSDMSQANLYGFGRLAWNPDLSAARIAEEWTRLTFGSNPKVIQTVVDLQLKSWRAYEDYTGPLGLQTLTAIVGDHYGVSVEASERNGWGQWHRADETGVGMDRTVATGTGYTGQYRPSVAARFESLSECPDDLLLFMHHVPYTHILHSGKTVIQSLYDSHYAGAETAENFVAQWLPLKGLIDDQRYAAVLAQLQYQAGRAEVWRDAICNYFLRLLGIPDQQGHAGHHPDRIEAESATLEGYTPVDVTPWEAASGGKAVACALEKCVLTFRYAGESGWHDLRVEYFDQNNGAAHYRVFVADQLVDEWMADDHLPTGKLDGSSTTRREIYGIALRQGDEIRVEGRPDGGEAAALDYVEIVRHREE